MKAKAPRNVEFVGKLGSAELNDFYERSRMIVVPKHLV